MKIVKSQDTPRGGSFIFATIYPFLQPEDREPESHDLHITVVRPGFSGRIKVHVDMSEPLPYLTQIETIELCQALLMAAKLAQVYSELP